MVRMFLFASVLLALYGCEQKVPATDASASSQRESTCGTADKWRIPRDTAEAWIAAWRKSKKGIHPNKPMDGEGGAANQSFVNTGFHFPKCEFEEVLKDLGDDARVWGELAVKPCREKVPGQQDSVTVARVVVILKARRRDAGQNAPDKYDYYDFVTPCPTCDD